MIDTLVTIRNYLGEAGALLVEIKTTYPDQRSKSLVFLVWKGEILLYTEGMMSDYEISKESHKNQFRWDSLPELKYRIADSLDLFRKDIPDTTCSKIGDIYKDFIDGRGRLPTLIFSLDMGLRSELFVIHNDSKFSIEYSEPAYNTFMENTSQFNLPTRALHVFTRNTSFLDRMLPQVVNSLNAIYTFRILKGGFEEYIDNYILMVNHEK